MLEGEPTNVKKTIAIIRAFQCFKIARMDGRAKAESGKNKPLSAFRFEYPTDYPF
jgi:hypothetical protein